MAISINGTGPITGASTLNGLTIPTLGFGKLLQVAYGSSTASVTSTTAATYIDTGLSATITPTSSTSKILVLVSHGRIYKDPGSDQAGEIRLMRGSTQLAANGFGYAQGNHALDASTSFIFLDTPATTSSITYKTTFSKSFSTSANVAVYGLMGMALLEIAP